MAKPSRRHRGLPPRAHRPRRERQATCWLVSVIPDGRTVAVLSLAEALAVGAVLAKRAPLVAVWRARFPAAQAPAAWSEARFVGLGGWANAEALAGVERAGLPLTDGQAEFRWLSGDLLRAHGARIEAPPDHALVGVLRKAA